MSATVRQRKAEAYALITQLEAKARDEFKAALVQLYLAHGFFLEAQGSEGAQLSLCGCGDEIRYTVADLNSELGE